MTGFLILVAGILVVVAVAWCGAWSVAWATDQEGD